MSSNATLSSISYDYDYDKIKDAQKFAKKTKNEYLEALIEGFLFENDPEYRHIMYQAIVDGVSRAKKVWNLTP
ncbi:MAG: hypothetical protein ACE5J3_05275 [Methanosarcinales archaeon]